MTPINYTLEWNEEDIQNFLELTKSVYRRATELLAIEVWRNIMKEAPTDHGRLAGSWQMEPYAELDQRIYSNVEYALFVHEGTGVHGPTGHRIVPRTARALAFDWQGRHWVLRSVAGQQPNPYADRAIDQADQRSQEFIRQAISELGAA